LLQEVFQFPNDTISAVGEQPEDSLIHNALFEREFDREHAGTEPLNRQLHALQDLEIDVRAVDLQEVDWTYFIVTWDWTSTSLASCLI
jgi:hypothetical protein